MNKKLALIESLNKHFPDIKLGRAKFKLNEFIEVISKSEDYNLALELGYKSNNGPYRTIKKLFPEKAQNVKICTYLLSLDSRKACSKCFEVKEYLEFNIKSENRLHSECKTCSALYQKEYQKTHQLEQRARTNKRRAAELQAIPKWADIKEIAKIYINCPKDYHVDHIIPLQGENVCGLHVENNLQYLTIEENLSKGNKF